MDWFDIVRKQVKTGLGIRNRGKDLLGVPFSEKKDWF